MALQFDTGLRNALLDQIESTISTAPILRIYESTGTPPATPATAANGTVLAEITLPSDWMAAASSGSKALAGTWQDASANATGTADYFRIYNSGDTTCYIQGTVSTVIAGTGDMQLDNTSISTGQSVTISTFTLTDGNS